MHHFLDVYVSVSVCVCLCLWIERNEHKNAEKQNNNDTQTQKLIRTIRIPYMFVCVSVCVNAYALLRLSPNSELQ